MKSINGSFFGNMTLMRIVLLLAPALLYFKSLFYDFSPVDEQWMIVKNSDFLGSWDNLGRAFSQPMGIYFRPLFVLSLMLDYHLGGLSPFVYHLSNLLLHLTAVQLLFFYLQLHGAPIKTTFILSLLFSIHPALLHAVAWVPGRNDSLLTVFVLAALIQLHLFISSHNNRFLLLHLLFFVRALLSKESAVMLPVIFLAQYLVRKKPERQELFSLSFLWLLPVLVWWLWRHQVAGAIHASAPDLPQSLHHFFTGFLVYLGKSFFPIGQSLFPTVKNISVIPGLITLGLIVLLALKPGIQTKRSAGLGLLIFVIMLAVPLWFSSISSGGELYEHRLYLPLVGLMIFLSSLRLNWNAKALFYGAMVLVLALGTKSLFRMNVYKDQATYLKTGLEEVPDYYFFYMQTADLFYAKKNYQEALHWYSKALTWHPGDAGLLNNRGCVYTALGRYREAIQDFNLVLSQPKFDPYACLNRCIAYNNLDDPENAMKDLIVLRKCCVNIVPSHIEEDVKSKWVRSTIKKLDEQLSAKPDSAKLYVQRARLLMEEGRKDQALADLEKACHLEPDNAEYATFLKEKREQ